MKWIEILKSVLKKIKGRKPIEEAPVEDVQVEAKPPKPPKPAPSPAPKFPLPPVLVKLDDDTDLFSIKPNPKQ